MSVKQLSRLLPALFLLASCSPDYDWDDVFPGGMIPSGPSGGVAGGGTSSSSTIDFGTLSTFTVEVNTESMLESETIPSDEADTYYNEYIENNFSKKATTTITFDGTSAEIAGQVSGDLITVSGSDVLVEAHSKGLVICVKGTSSKGSLKIVSEKKFSLELDNLTLTNPDGAAINIQEGNCFVVLKGKNTLSDSSSATYTPDGEEDMKAVFFSEDDLRFSGSGSLLVNALNAVEKNGITSDDAIFIRPNTNIQVVAGSNAGNGIKANDDIVIKGGVINVETAGKGSKGIKAEGNLEIFGGRITSITTGGVDTSDSSDPSGCAALRAELMVDIYSGELHLMSTGQGGKGISADDNINISGGELYIITTGSMYGSSSSGGFGGGFGGWGGGSSNGNSVSPKGIRSDKDINISGGDIFVRTSGGTNAEGIESKATLTFSGGNTAVSAYDDAFNASTSIVMTGGKAFAISTGNCDGIDSNGTLKVTGGVLIGVASSTNSEDGFDYEKNASISNATVIALSSGGMGNGTISGCVTTSVTGDSGSYVSLCSGSSPLVTFTLPRTYKNGRLIVSAPSVKSGSSYTLMSGVTVSGGTQWMNYVESPTSVSGGSSTSVKAN